MHEHQPSSGQQSGASTQIERRAFVRVASDLDADCRPAGHAREQGWPGRVRDISAGGLGLLLRHCFHPGTYLTVELRERGSADVRRSLTVRVVHATGVLADGHACWLLGCAFDEPLGEDELHALC